MRLLTWVALVLLLLASPSSAKWTTSDSKDEMTGKRSCYAHSASTTPNEQMGFPYHDVTAWLGFGCSGTSEWAYIGFSTNPNLTGTTIGDGYNTLATRIKWDDHVETVHLTQTWGASFIHFQNDSSAIAKMRGASTVLLELPWYGEGKVYFRFSLDGSSSAISAARACCR